jgi:hypothetical protein
MIPENKCIVCGRMYRGEGYKGHCTSHCHAVENYASAVGWEKAKNFKGNVKGDKRRERERSLLDAEKEQAEKNKKHAEVWKKGKYSHSAKKNREIGEKLNTAHVRKTIEFDDRKFSSVRG